MKTSTQEFQWDVFISFAGTDRAAALDLYRALQARELHPFLAHGATRSVEAGSDWTRAVKEALDRSRLTAVLLSPETERSAFQRDEIVRALKRAEDPSKHRVVPVILPERELAEVDLPIGLGIRQAIRLRGANPIDELAERLVDLLNHPGQEVVQTSDDLEHIREDLEREVQRKHDLDARGEDTAAVVASILQLKRLYRAERRDLAEGDFLADRYRLRWILGSGGFGDVWRAYDSQDHREVALKVLHSQWVRSADRRERFFRGARQMNGLRHVGIASVLEAKREDGPYPFFVMELMSDGDLAHAVLQGRVGHDAALEMLCQVGSALQYAHDRGVVHRDVKPENILLEGRRAVLTDFDLVHAFDTTGRTRSMAHMGTFLFSAPEVQIDAAKADHRADVYSLGVCAIFAMLRRPLDLNDFRDWPTCIEQLSVNAELREVLERATAYEPPARLSSCAELVEALRSGRLEDRTSTFADLPSTPARPALVLVRPGRFMMGSPQDEDGRDPDEQLHEVALTRPFLMAATPVTQAQYRHVSRREPARFRGPSRPVESLSWFDAVDYLNALSISEGLKPCYERVRDAVVWVDGLDAEGFRLPTEAEWEFAARARGTERGERYGDLDEIAWYGRNSMNQTHPVARKAPNKLGLFDLFGNVRDWCWDWRDKSIPTDEVDPIGPPRGSTRAFRGGWWGDTPRYLRFAFRDGGIPQNRDEYIGVRPVRTVRADGI